MPAIFYRPSSANVLFSLLLTMSHVSLFSFLILLIFNLKIGYHFLDRPTEYQEEDLYLCESKYFFDEKAIRRLKKGLKVSIL